MIQRTIAFFHAYEMPILNGFTMDGGYSRLVSSGDGDYVTETTLLDMKSSTSHIYLNPYNGEAIPYSAQNMTSRKVWRDGVKALIENERPLYLEGRNEATLTTSAVSTALSIVSNLKDFKEAHGLAEYLRA